MLQSKTFWLVILAILFIAAFSYALFKHSQAKTLKEDLAEKLESLSDLEKKLVLYKESPYAEEISANEYLDENATDENETNEENDEDTEGASQDETIQQLKRELTSLKSQIAQNKNLYSGSDKKLAARLDSLAKANTALTDFLYFLNERYQKLRLNRNLYTLTNAKGEKIYYFGDMKGDIAEGYGVAIWPTGEIYKGEWKNNRRHGKGILTWDNGEKFVGDFVDDKRHGYGIFNTTNGNRYEGEWKNDQQHGMGTLFDKSNKAVKQGTWENGHFKG